MRICIYCGKESVSNIHGVSTCPGCIKKNKLEYMKEYRLTHKDNSSLRTKKWRVSEKGKKYIESDRCKEVSRRYMLSGKGKVMICRRDAKRRGNLLQTECSLTSEEWESVLEAHNYRCNYCGIKTELTVDHIIPISKGGKHNKENVTPSCRSCNSSKGDRLIVSDGYQMWNKTCPICLENTIQVVRPGKVQCINCS